MTIVYDLPTPEDFNYRAVLNSHGWGDLLPFSRNDAAQTLERIHRLSDGRVVRFVLRPGVTADTVRLEVENEADVPEISAAAARILNFDQPLAEFYAVLQPHASYAWIEAVGAGRMLASPTVWEDLAKTLLTTNTTWRQTGEMVRRLASLGDAHVSGAHTFPTPEQVAALPLDVFAERVRAGYRSAYLHGLATAIVAGAFDAEALRDSALPSSEVYRRIKSIKGFGDYAAGATMRLLSRFDQLGLDSECRSMYVRRFNNGSAATDREIAAFYAPFGGLGGVGCVDGCHARLAGFKRVN